MSPGPALRRVASAVESAVLCIADEVVGSGSGHGECGGAGHIEVRPGYVRAVWPMAASALIVDEAERVLLVNPVYHPDRWLMVGGGMDRDGLSPQATCARELREELGIDWPVGDLLVVHWVPRQDPHFEELLYVFDGGVMDTAAQSRIHLPQRELTGCAFLGLQDGVGRLDEVDGYRLREAFEARRAQAGPRYLEAGRPVN